MQTKHLRHRHGGRIVAIHSVGHVTERGVAWWFYRADVVFDDAKDGKVHHDMELAPTVICYGDDEAGSRDEYITANDALSRYLATEGRWHDQKTKGDLVYSWTPKKKEGSRQIEDLIAECQKEAA